jgi:hypothetical protein
MNLYEHGLRRTVVDVIVGSSILEKALILRRKYQCSAYDVLGWDV